MRRNIIVPTLLFACTLAVSAAGAMSTVPEATFSVQPPSTAPAKPADCAAIKEMCDEMMASKKAADARLEALLVAMNDAKGSAKVDATAAVVNELVKQRSAMHEHMMRMHAATNEHLMQHMWDAAPADMQKKMKQAMDGCPMIHDMNGKDGEDTGAAGHRGGSGGG